MWPLQVNQQVQVSKHGSKLLALAIRITGTRTGIFSSEKLFVNKKNMIKKFEFDWLKIVHYLH
jgi:hypothetical protein